MKIAAAMLAAWLAASALVQAAPPAPPSPPSPTPQPSPRPTAGGLGHLRADRIRYETREQVMIAIGNVVLTVDDMEIRTDLLRWEPGPQIVTATGQVTVRRGGMHLTAPNLRYEVQTETADAFGGAVLVQDGATVRAPQIRFELKEDVAVATGGVEVLQEGTTVLAPSLRYLGRTGEVTADGGVTVTQPGSRLTGRRLNANLKARRAEVSEEATLIRSPGSPAGRTDRPAGALAKEETIVTAARIAFRWDVNEAEANTNVVIRQRDKTAWADKATYSEKADQMVLIGRVILEQQSGEWLTREGVVPTPRDPSARDALASFTRLECRRLTMSLREGDLVAEGPLNVTQKNRSATGDRATYTEADRRLVVTGNVRILEADGRRLQADRAVISLADETFEAEGNVQTEFTMRRAPTPTPRP